MHSGKTHPDRAVDKVDGTAAEGRLPDVEQRVELFPEDL
jgi:hypothetical protein